MDVDISLGLAFVIFSCGVAVGALLRRRPNEYTEIAQRRRMQTALDLRNDREK